MKLIILLPIILLAFASLNFITVPQKGKNQSVDDKVEQLLSQMTIEEKVGQMTQITMEAISSQRGYGEQKHILDTAMVRLALKKYHVGSFLNVYDMAHSLEYWHYLQTFIQDVATKETRLKIPIIYGIDAIHGVNYTLGATLFPQAISMAATRNRSLVEKAGEITAVEMKASGIPWNFNPVLGMGREPLWPRFWETYGEDVYLTTEMGKKYIYGQQGNDIGAKDKVATCMKHYLGYSVPKNGADRTPAWIPERELREIFLPPFKAAVDQGCLTAMVNSSEINGIPSHSDHFILTDLLKGELGFEGFIVSDWEDIERLHTRDRVAATPKEAVKMAVMAGMDMSMVPFDFSFYDYLLELVNDGEVPIERIDDAVSRILKVKMKLGLFENPYPDKEFAKNFAKKEYTQINLDAARESITLVKNEHNFLPLNKDCKVLVTGPNANKLSVLNGGWTITWQGNEESFYPQEKFTILEAIQNKIGNENTVYVEGTTTKENINIDEAVKAAEDVDAVIVCLGEDPYCETEGNINDLTLDKIQLELVNQLSKTGKPIVLVMVQGRPRVINEIVGLSNSILVAMLPGMEGGIAISDILFGDVNPSGKLPFSYPKHVNGNTCYDYKPIESFDVNFVDPQWTFGHGLSYTNFKYSDLNLDKEVISEGESLNASIKVKNNGIVAGKETVELYLTDLYGTVTRPVIQLKGFEKISLNPDEEKIVTFVIRPNQLSFIGRDNKRVIEPGEFYVTVGNLTKSFILK